MNFLRKNENLFIPKVLVTVIKLYQIMQFIMYAQSGVYNQIMRWNKLWLSSDLNFKNIILSEKDKHLPNIEELKHMEELNHIKNRNYKQKLDKN